MKKILAIIVCILMIMPCFVLGIMADDEEKDRNIAAESSTYATSQWNLDSNPRWMVDTDRANSYRFWRPGAPERGEGYESVDVNNQYCGFKFSKYYEFNEVTIYAQKLADNNNVTYTVKALVLGEWITLGSVRNESITDLYDTPVGTCGKFTIKLPEYTTTKNIRIAISTYGSAEGGNGNWWEVPIIQEVEINGKHATELPIYDVPEGAVLSKNAVLGGMSSASSSTTNKNPAKACDNLTNTSWSSSGRNDGEWWMSEFDRAYEVDKLFVNFGGSYDGYTMKYTVSVRLEDGTWKDVATNKTIETTAAIQENIEFTLSKATKITAMKVTYSDISRRAVLTEAGANIASDDKCLFLDQYMTFSRTQSTAAGNLAPYGTAYASSTFEYAGASFVDYINDGKVSDSDFVWISGDRGTSSYCGVTLKEKHKVSKVVLLFNDKLTGGVDGDCVLSFDVLAKSGDNFVKVGSGTSYDSKTGKYIASVVFDEIETDDIRIQFTSNGTLYPYIKELEVYEEGFVYGGYTGITIDKTQYTVGGAAATERFMPVSVPSRCEYMDFISPVRVVKEIIALQKNS